MKNDTWISYLSGFSISCITISKCQYPPVMPQFSSPLEHTVTMPWDVDRYLGRSTDLSISSDSKTRTDSSRPPPRLFTICPDIFQCILDQLTKKDAFRLSQTCKTFMRHYHVLKTIFHEPISITDIDEWYQNLSGYDLKRKLKGPPVTLGINASTGPLVRRLALPEWTSLQDIHHLIACCPNLDTIDFTEIIVSTSAVGGHLGLESDGSEDDERKSECINTWPPMLDQCPALFSNLRSVHLCHGSWQTTWNPWSLPHPRTGGIPKILSLAENLRTLSITCRQQPLSRLAPETRRQASAKLLADILNIISRGLTTLALYESASTICNLEHFVQSLAVFPKLRTIKLSLHHDLLMYQENSRIRHNLEHDTASAFQYLSIIKKISDKGRVYLISSDSGEEHHHLPHEFYGLSQSELVLGPRDDLWTPVWTWNDRLNWVECHESNSSVRVIDIAKCRTLFEELRKARIHVSIELEPLRASTGGIFASNWVDIVSSGQRPKQHFIQRQSLTKIRLENLSRYRDILVGSIERYAPAIASNPELFRKELTHSEVIARQESQTSATAACSSPEGSAQERAQLEETVNGIARLHLNSGASNTIEPETDIPNPVWRLNEIGDLVDDLRLKLDRRFVCTYADGEYCDINSGGTNWSKAMYNCRTPLRDRLWREAEYTALLFRRIPVDFPRLTRFALYIPAALYPNHDQTFINHALPGTGWTVSHYGKHHDAMDSCRPLPEAYIKFVDDVCPFVHRIFTRPTPTDDPAAVIVHDEEWHVTKRPLFDLDGEYKSMDQLLTEPLRENYTMEEED